MKTKHLIPVAPVVLLLGLICLAGLAIISSAQAPSGAIFVVVGDSRSTTYGHSSGKDWPSIFMGLKWASGNSVTKVICATSGNTVQDMIDNYNTCVHPQRPAVTGKDVFMACVDCAINDVHNGTPSATILAKLETLWGLANADDIKVIASTIAPNGNDGDALQRIRQEVNVGIAHSLKPDWLVPMAIVTPNMSDPAVSSDKLHYEDFGAELTARAVDATLMGLPVRAADDAVQSIDGEKYVRRLGVNVAAAAAPVHVSGTGELFRLEATGDHEARLWFANFYTGASMSVGIEGSTGGQVLTGSAPYAGVIGPGASGSNLYLGASGAAKASVRNDGNIEILGDGKGIILHSANGSQCRLLILDNSGNLATASCP